MKRLDFIEAENLTCLRSGRRVFRDVSFRLCAGENLSVEGPNGAGKSSLLRMLAGWLNPASGAIRFNGSVRNEEQGKFVGWLGHQDAIKPQMTVRETLHFFARLFCEKVIASELEAAEAAVGLQNYHDIACQYLSAGQKKRLALARLTLMRRPLWLLDEPLAALDTQAKTLCATLIEAHRADGGLVIAATHEPLGVVGKRLTLGET